MIKISERPIQLKNRAQVLELIASGHFDDLLHEMTDAISRRRLDMRAQIREQIVKVYGNEAAAALDAIVEGR